MEKNKDITTVKEKLSDLIELWCVLNTLKDDFDAKLIMETISSVIKKEALLKRWNELHPVSKAGVGRPRKKQLPYSNDTKYMKRRKAIISKLLINLDDKT